MIGKQALNAIIENIFPLVWKQIRLLTVPEARKDHGVKWPLWAADFKLNNFDPRGLFPEYLEMSKFPSCKLKRVLAVVDY